LGRGFDDSCVESKSLRIACRRVILWILIVPNHAVASLNPQGARPELVPLNDDGVLCHALAPKGVALIVIG
jgi:hypothetical protein